VLHPVSLCSVSKDLELTDSVPDQIIGAVASYFWPKIFFDFWTKTLDGSVKPYPYLQTINLICGLLSITLEWPLTYIADTAWHRSFEGRFLLYPFAATAGILVYQMTDPALYYLIGTAVYFWAFCEGEEIMPKAWQIKKRQKNRGGKV
jgi:hypothetical protein